MKPNLFRELITALLCGLILLQSAQAAAPGWWSTQGLVIPQHPADDHAVLNQGQLKNFVRAAVYELHAKLPGGAGTLLNNLLYTWRTQKLHADDYAAVTLGQLKAVAQPVYASMQAAGLPLPVPWTSLTTDDDDHAVANLGQAKAVFAFVVPDLVTLGMLDSDGDGFSDALELALGTSPYLSSSHPAGLGDVSVGGGGAGGNGSGGAGGAGGGGGLPPYVDPYPEPWPDFEAAAAADANKDSDNDGVPDVFDAVWYDPKFKHTRSGFPHYNIIDLGKCEGGFMDMADSGALVWRENSVYDSPRLRVWTPEHVGDEDGPTVIEWDSESFGLDDGYSGWLPGSINNEGKLLGVASQQIEGESSKRRHFLYDPQAQSASWMAHAYPDEGQYQWVTSHGLTTVFGPEDKAFGTVNYQIYPEDEDAPVQHWSAFFKLSTNEAVLEDEFQHLLPPLPEDPPDPESEPLGTREKLEDPAQAVVFYDPGGYGASGTGVLLVSHRYEQDVYQQVFAGDPYSSWGDYWDYSFDSDPETYQPVYLKDEVTFELVTATQTHTLKTVDLLEEESGYWPWWFGSISPAAEPWLVGVHYDWEDWNSESFIFKPATPGGAYAPCAIYAGFEDYQAGSPIDSIGLLTAQGQAIVYGDFDKENETEWETGLWADGEVQTMDKVISGYEHYLHDPDDWQHRWQFHDVSRDGMIAATAWNGTEQRMLLLIPVTTREILANGQLAPAGGGVQASMPSPVLNMTCVLENPRVLADGSVVGDLKVGGTITSKACDNVQGVKGKITQAQLWVNGADTPQAVIAVDASDKQPTGTRARPYPFTGVIPTGTVIPNVPLTAGVNTFKFTAYDPVYGMPGYSTWAATITVTDPTEEDGGSGGGVVSVIPASLEGLTLSVELPAATLSATVAETVSATFTADGAAATGLSLTETAAASGVFTATLADGRPARLSLVNVAALSATAADSLQATLLVGEPGTARAYGTLVAESAPASGQFSGSRVTSSGGGTVIAGGGGTGGSSSGGGATGTDPTNTGGSTDSGGAGGGGAATPVVSLDGGSFEGMQEVAASNGGEFHRYAICVGVPDALKDSLKLEFGDEEFELIEDTTSGLMVLKDPRQDGTLPFSASFAPHADEAGAPVEPPSDHQKRMDELEDEDSFTKGFALGLGYGGLDMVKSTGETIVGAAKFAGRGVLQVGLRFKWAANWITGADNSGTNEMIAQVDAAQGAVIDQGLALGKFLGTLLVDTAVAVGKAEIGLLTGDLELMRTALHGSETHRKIFEMAAEAITQTVKDMGPDSSSGQKGYVIGKIVFEVASMLIPATKVGTLMQVTKAQVLQRLTSKAGLLKPLAHAKAVRKKGVCDGPWGCFMAGEQVVTQSEHGHTNIEDIRKNDVVWSRDELDPVRSGWRRVTDVQVTHPREIYHLTYELRGPPCEAGSQPAASMATETLKVTGEHPFWVGREASAGFVPVKELRIGDVFSRADGGTAVVTRMLVEHAPSGESFTTYNFTVEGYHTYFVGHAGVWVHNAYTNAQRRQLQATMLDNLAEHGGGHIDHLGKDRFPALAKQRNAHLSQGGQQICDPIWMEHGKHNSDKIIADFQSGVIGSIDDVPTVRQWDEEFFLRPMDFSYKNAIQTREWPVGMLRRGNHVLHHVVMQEWNIFLMKKGRLSSIVDIHKVPGAVLTKEVHDAIHNGPNGMNALMRQIKAKYPEGVSMSLGQAQEEIGKIIEKYRLLGHPAQAKLFESYFQALGILP